VEKGVLAIAVLVSLASSGLGLTGCFPTETGRKDELRDRAQELIPAGGRLLVIHYGDCVELASSPSCAQVVFKLAERDSGRRAALVRAEAERHGWTVSHADDAPGGWSVFATRDGFTAVALLWRPEVYGVDCANEPDPRSEDERFCFNTLNIQR
jgi:hypothetical protein